MDQLREHFMRYSLLKLAAISVAALTLAACARNEAAQAPPPAPQACTEGSYDQNGNWIPSPNCYSNQQQYPQQQQQYPQQQQQYPQQQYPQR